MFLCVWKLLHFKYQSLDVLVEFKSNYFIINHHIDKVRFVMNLLKLTVCIIPKAYELNDGLCLSSSSLALYTQDYCCFRLSIASLFPAGY